jgi:hypothetical protein
MAADPVHLGICLPQGDAWLETPQDNQPVEIAVYLLGSEHEGHDDLPLQPVRLSRGLNADHRVELAI